MEDHAKSGQGFVAFASQPAVSQYSRALDKMSTMQVNVGLACNLACKHCHLAAGPNRREAMERDTMDACLRLARQAGFDALDITGGAPEMNPNLPYLLEGASHLGIHTMVRTNLTILEEDGYTDYPALYARYGIELVASLPHYDAGRTDRMRGQGTFASCIRVLRTLNRLGYGIDPALRINLVYNPGGAFLPPGQDALREEYTRKLEATYGVQFNDLFAITNNPIGRFGDFLDRSGNYAGYMTRLTGAFNPAAVQNMMCRSQISVRWDGKLYDCDFNLALDLPSSIDGTVFDVYRSALSGRRIAFGDHCYACTAGAGSSCGGTTA